MKQTDQLLRTVSRKNSTQLEPNPDARIPGKGAYFCKTEDCLERLQHEKKLRRLFRDRFKEDCLSWMLGLRKQIQPGNEVSFHGSLNSDQLIKGEGL